MSKIKETGVFQKYSQIKNEVPNENPELLRKKQEEIEETLDELERSYENHLGT